MSYITFSTLGESGGMCSQLQSYASLLAVAKANDKEIVFSESMFDKGCTIKIFDLLKITPNIKPDDFFSNFTSKQIDFHTTSYDKSLFNLDTSINYDLTGRFDLYTYWYNDIKEEIDKWEFKRDISLNAENRLNKIKEKLGDKPTVSIHIRRGDYTLPRNAPLNIINQDYYLQAIAENFEPVNDYSFIIFSNDIDYVKNLHFVKFINKKYNNIWFVEPKEVDSYSYTSSEKEDLTLLSMCDNHIITNSSYSWWGAYLSKNPNKKVICPTNWLKGPSFINGNHFPPSWINIDNKN